MSSHLWPKIEISKVNSSWFRPLQPGELINKIQIPIDQCFHSHLFICLAREDLSLSKFEELLEQERRRYIDKGTELVSTRHDLQIPSLVCFQVVTYHFMGRRKWTMRTWVNWFAATWRLTKEKLDELGWWRCWWSRRRKWRWWARWWYGCSTRTRLTDQWCDWGTRDDTRCLIRQISLLHSMMLDCK